VQSATAARKSLGLPCENFLLYGRFAGGDLPREVMKTLQVERPPNRHRERSGERVEVVVREAEAMFGTASRVP
jgi:hypothetical protein